MKAYSRYMVSLPRQLAVITLASAIVIPAWAQNQDQQSQDQQNQVTTGTSGQSATSQPSPAAQQPLTNQQKEGFWGRVNPFARKSWVKKRIDPISDRLNELDEVNAKNAQDIKDVDARAQAGIQKAQSAADQANQVATAANSQAQSASNTAQQAAQHVDSITGTVGGLDQYHQITEAEITFHGSSPVLTADSKTTLDQLASSLTGREGYIIEMDAQSPAPGSVGLQRSEQLADAVERYLVTQHQIPIYRMHAVALGNEVASVDTTANTNNGGEEQKPPRVRTSSVHLRLMENSLAARAAAPPQNAPAAAGAEQP